jgi:hypothetical protein
MRDDAIAIRTCPKCRQSMTEETFEEHAQDVAHCLTRLAGALSHLEEYVGNLEYKIRKAGKK